MPSVYSLSPLLDDGPRSVPKDNFANIIQAHTGITAEDGIRALRDCLTVFAGRIAVVSSFGSQSAVLLAFVSEIAPATPVLFIETGKLFPETLRYQQDLTAFLGLLDVRIIRPVTATLQARDSMGELHMIDANACCKLRKVEPLEQALAPFAAWVNGRRRVQTETRAVMAQLEEMDGRLKVNPLAHWDNARIEEEFVRRGLPRHPLTARGYASLGCSPCTDPVATGADPRSGRWPTSTKTECGIHRVQHPIRQ
jgi:phosphoadenosine phosphosulfate reductase